MAEFTEFPLNLNDEEEQQYNPPRPKKQKPEKKKNKVRTLWDEAWSRGKMDLTFMMLAFLLLAVGLVMLLSASFASSYYDTLKTEGVGNPALYFQKQLKWACIGVVILFVACRFPVRWYYHMAKVLLIVSVSLLILVFVIGTVSHGSKRWISFGPVGFQPSEIAKLTLIVCFSKWISNLGPQMKTGRYGFWPFIGVIGIFALLLIIEPHISATIIICTVGLVMMWTGGTKWYWLVGLIVIAVLGYTIIVENQEYLQDKIGRLEYIYTRLDAWRYTYDRTRVDKDKSWQVVQSLNAVGSGGLLGLGFGQSRQKYLYLPEEHNDYIFAIICEELGFVGAALVLLLFAILIIRGFWLALHCKDIFTRMVVVGLMTLLSIQVLLNVAVVTNTLPATGISLPFFSYGGSALCMQMGEIGVVLSASRDIPDK